MTDTKLITIIKSLTPEQFAAFRRFVVSPFFNTNRNISRLLEYVKKGFPEFKSQKFTKPNAFKFIFQNQRYNDAKLRILMAKLLNLLEEFIVIETYSSDVCLKSINLLTAVRRKRLYKYYANYYALAQKAIENFPFRHSKYYFYRHELEFENFQFRVTDRTYGAAELQKMNDALDLYYLVKKFDYSSNMIQRKFFISGNYRKHFLDYLIRYVKKLLMTSKKDLSELFPAISVYLHFILLFTDKEEKLYLSTLRDLLTKYARLFPDSEAYYLFNLLTGYLVAKRNRERYYVEQLFEIYNYLLTQKFFLRDNQIRAADYHNISANALYIKKYKWTEDFLQRFRNKLDIPHRDNLFFLESARLSFYRKDYDSALRDLSKIDAADYNYYMDSRTILTKIYYETNEVEGLFSLLDSFKHYLMRNKIISKEVKNHHIKYISLTGKLFRIKIGEKSNIKEVKEELKANPRVVSKEWLQEKARALE